MPSFARSDPYSIGTYIREYAFHRTETQLLIDRNIYSDILDLTKGDAATDDSRISAAVMAFASCAYIDIEPVLAMHEGASSEEGGDWQMQLARFRTSDDLHPSNWAMIALAEAPGFEREIASNPKHTRHTYFDPQLKLRSFGFNYPSALKLATLTRRGGNREFRLKEFIDWMYSKWVFSGPAMTLAVIALSASTPKRVFRWMHSLDRDLALRGVLNATWDLVYAQEWLRRVEKQNQTNTLHVLCTRDDLLRRLTELLRVGYLEVSDSAVMLRGNGFNKSVAALYVRCQATLNDCHRPTAEHRSNPEYRSALIQELEAEYK